uniref:Fibronectin type-III domain-containing protein n=1 Tax=Anser cygnoides TaxID=8845 RepID=A0A8B9ER97_ANSCY|nr:cytokine receptor common subunit beta-like [Anser cygnoides]
MLVCKGLKMPEFISLLLAPCLVWGAETMRESIPMQTLHCYPDYNSLTTCIWMECSEAHQFLNVTLNFNHSHEKNKEMTCAFHKGENHTKCQNFTIHWVCQSHLRASNIERYKFKPDLNLQAELNVYLFQNVQPLPPQNLSVRESSGDFLLTWTAAEGSQGLGNALEYEVTYKREWESWEKAASRLLSNTTRCHLSHLVPGSRYVARVRARAEQARGFPGPFSEWSTDVSWETPEGQERIQPRNLRCLFNGANLLTCSWEVKKVITTSVIFGLFFRATPASAEEECSPVYEKALPHIPYVVQSCAIPVSNISSQSRYHVSVRTKTEEKLIEAYKNIKVLPPTNVTVTMNKDGDYELRWIKHTKKRRCYEVLYWKTSQMEKVTRMIINDEPYFLLRELEPSTTYTVKMRAKLHGSEGLWSEWSEEFTWKTDSVLSPVLLPVMLTALTITLLIIGYYSYKYFLRQNKLWEEKIPNPGKSRLIQSFLGARGTCTLQGVPASTTWSYSKEAVSQLPASQVGFSGQNTSEGVEEINCLQVLDGMIKNSSPEFHGAKPVTENVSHGTLDPQICQTSEVPHKTTVSSAALVCPLNQSAALTGLLARLPCKSAADASTASQTAITCFAFNGPYLYSPGMSSQPEMHQTLQVDPVGNQEKSVSLQGHESVPRHHGGKRRRSSAAFSAPRSEGNNAASQR